MRRGDGTTSSGIAFGLPGATGGDSTVRASAGTGSRRAVTVERTGFSKSRLADICSVSGGSELRLRLTGVVGIGAEDDGRCLRVPARWSSARIDAGFVHIYVG